MPEGWCFQCHKGIGQAEAKEVVRTVQVCSFCWNASQGHRNIAQKPSMANGGSHSLYGRQTFIPGQDSAVLGLGLDVDEAAEDLLCRECSMPIQGACVGGGAPGLVCWKCHKKNRKVVASA